VGIVEFNNRLISGADAGSLRYGAAAAPVASAAKPPAPKPPPAMATKQPVAMSCQQTLTLSFFFDGTGNNLDADVSTWEHSNVARLYRSHLEDSDAAGRYRFYLPGIGTYFMDREVQDEGGRLDGNAFGRLGQARLDFAFARLKEKIRDAEARAENPTNKICWIKVSAFGFSRGAALARAFCRDLEKLCAVDESSPTGWHLKQGKYPIEISFLGVFDTVASAGVPPSGNNLHRNRFAKILSQANPVAKKIADWVETPELKRLAFGNMPGADPAPGPFDGHGDWAEGMAIGNMVKKCVHMMAAHENRNSFALDTALASQGVKLVDGKNVETFAAPSTCIEMLFPGVHSDVGGGYRPGEGGCKNERGAQLSLITLRAMHPAALEAGVPLVPLSGLTGKEREDFAIDDAGAPHYAAMVALWDYYKAAASKYSIANGVEVLGTQFNQHMRAYYSWRFQAMRAKKAAQAAGATTEQEQQVSRNEAVFSKDREAIAAELKRARIDFYMAQGREELLRMALEDAQENKARNGTPIDPALTQQIEKARQEKERRRIVVDRLRAREDGAADDSKLNANITKYDKMLVEDAKQIVAWMRETPSLKLRPHYYALVQAYLDEFERGAGMRDPKLIEFFDEYVHNSLAAFDKDQTWPSDPRILYAGGDHKLRYAAIDRKRNNAESQAA
jgi:hypothetical protein